MSTKEIGDIGESFVEQFLINKGLTILARNFRYRHGEIDIIAKSENRLHFVEVKSRKPHPMVDPVYSITYEKMGHIVDAAAEYQKRNKTTDKEMFDVVFVEIEDSIVYNIKYCQNVFIRPAHKAIKEE